MENATLVTTAADQLANKTDRWLFICAELVLAMFVVFAMRWLIHRHERLIEEHRMDQKEHTAQLTTLFVDCNSTREKLAVVIDRNTLALNETTGVIRELRAKV